MRLFKDKKNSLTGIKEVSFQKEKDIQSLIESNMDTIFGLEFISTEFTVDKVRLDSLAYDQESNAFVILEYKKKRSTSVVDQGYSYLATMLNNKADFVLKYNNNTGKQSKSTDFDWESSRAILISPSFTDHQRNSVNFKDVPFELWEIRKYTGDIITLEQCKPSSTESIKQLSKGKSDSNIAKVSSKVKVFSEEDHIAKLDDHVVPIWVSLKERLEAYSDTSFRPKEHSISWKIRRHNLCSINFNKKDKLELRVRRGTKAETGKESKGFFTLSDPRKLAEENISDSKVHRYWIYLAKHEDIDYVMTLMGQRYKALS